MKKPTLERQAHVPTQGQEANGDMPTSLRKVKQLDYTAQSPIAS
jgi:hypothetical protein